MKLIQIIAISILLLLAISVSVHSYPEKAAAQTNPNVYVGIDIAYGDIAATEQLIDKVSAYTNLLVIGCTGITYSTSNLNEVCQYIYDKNMSFIVFTVNPQEPPREWIDSANSNWGNRFLGLYVDDEIGGKQLDQYQNHVTVQEADNYSDAENQFVAHINWFLNFFKTNSNSAHVFTSDYAFYSFDYKAGYDTVFAEFGWNYSRQLNIALCRGAATAQNKDWGAIITYTCTTPPYLESGEDLYKDMVLAYENGAKYIVVFDTDENYQHSILSDDHLNAMKQFWQYTKDNPRNSTPTSERVAYVLPESYAYGFRGPNDKIWGLWQADSYSYVLSIGSNIMLEQYGTKLDIIYEDAIQSGNTLGYGSIVYWNDPTQVIQSWPPDASPFPFSTKSPDPSPTPSPTPSTSTPSLTASPTMEPTPAATSSATKDPGKGVLSIDSYLYGAAVAGAVVAIAFAAVMVFRKKR